MDLGDSFVTRKAGPMPVWAWMALGLAGALAYASMRGGRAAAEEDDSVESSGEYLPSSVQPTYAFVDADTTTITWPSAPPGGGRPPDDRTQPVPAPVPGRTAPGPYPVPPGRAVPTPPGRTAPAPYPTPPGRDVPTPPRGRYVTVTRWTSANAWTSTLTGIAQHELGKAALWRTIWNDPKNAALRRKRGAADRIQPGDRVWVSK